MTIDLVKHVKRSMTQALAGKSKLPGEVLFLAGLSSPTVRHFLNNLCSFRGANYLEIGTHKGSTLIPASYCNSGTFTAVDNFSEFGHTQPREVFKEVRKRFRADCHFTFHNADCWSPSLLRRLPTNINVYFYDGPHRYEDHYRAFLHYDPVFASRFVAVVDDWNSLTVREATREAFASLGYTMIFERELFTKRVIRDHWWNGILVAVVRKKRQRQRARRPRAAQK